MKDTRNGDQCRYRLILVAGAVILLGLMFGSTSAAAAADIWTATAPATASRSSHTSTLLQSGKVLITGGTGPNGELDSAELYDFLTGQFTAVAHMKHARTRHTATLLDNGKVLIVGGTTAKSDTFPYDYEGAELFDLANGKFTLTGPSFPIFSHTATLLSDGRVLIAGGSNDYNGNSLRIGADLYDPATGTFSAAGSMSIPRSDHTATLLPNGKVLITGGLTKDQMYGQKAAKTAELFDPAKGATGTFDPVSSPMNESRVAHTATLLSDGRVLIAGGYTKYPFVVNKSAELYDSNTGIFTPTNASMGIERWGHSAVLLPTGKVLISGGEGYSTFDDWNSAELYDPNTLGFFATASMTYKRHLHATTLLPNGKVLATGGTGVGSTAELFSTDLSGVQPQFVVYVNNALVWVNATKGHDIVLSASAQAGSYTGQNVDFWAVLFQFDAVSSSWLPWPPFLWAQGAFYSAVKRPIGILNWLPKGTYVILIGADMTMNGVFDLSTFSYGWVVLVIS
jgi:hypothetical protein